MYHNSRHGVRTSNVQILKIFLQYELNQFLQIEILEGRVRDADSATLNLHRLKEGFVFIDHFLQRVIEGVPAPKAAQLAYKVLQIKYAYKIFDDLLLRAIKLVDCNLHIAAEFLGKHRTIP